MLTKNQKMSLADLLLSIGDNEQILENFRSNLCAMKDFEPIVAFRQLDQEFYGKIDEINFSKFLTNNGYNFSLNDVKLYIKQHCSYDRMALRYPEFVKTLVPYDNKSLREIALSRPSNYQDQILTAEVQTALVRFIAKEIEALKELETKKQDFIRSLEITSVVDAFHEIDTHHLGQNLQKLQQQLGSFDFTHLKKYFTQLGFSLSDSQLICILRSLDKSEQGKIIESDFCQQISPVFPQISATSHYDQYLRKNTQKQIEQHTKLLSDLYQNNQEYYLIESTDEFKQRRTEQFKKTMQHYAHNAKLPLKEIQTIYAYNMNKDLENIKPLQQAISQFSDQLVNPLHTPPSDYANFLQTNYIELKTLMSTLYQFIKLDKQTFNCQLALTISPEFNVLDVFRSFDTKDKGYITASEFCKILQSKWKLKVQKRDVFILIRRFQEIENDGKLFFKHFVKMVVPGSKEEAKFLNCRLPYCQNQSSIEKVYRMYSKETKSKFQNFIKQIIENECVIEGLKQRLFQRKNFQLYNLFQIIDQNSDELITQQDLLKMFENFAIEVDQKDIKYLFSRFNSEDNLVIQFSEFFRQFTPTSPKLYSRQQN